MRSRLDRADGLRSGVGRLRGRSALKRGKAHAMAWVMRACALLRGRQLHADAEHPLARRLPVTRCKPARSREGDGLASTRTCRYSCGPLARTGSSSFLCAARCRSVARSSCDPRFSLSGGRRR
jgi:hypothetical protein